MGAFYMLNWFFIVIASIGMLVSAGNLILGILNRNRPTVRNAVPYFILFMLVILIFIAMSW